MSKHKHRKHRPIARRNGIAAALALPVFRQRIVRDKRKHKRITDSGY